MLFSFPWRGRAAQVSGASCPREPRYLAGHPPWVGIFNLVPLEDVGREDHVGDLAARARADVRLIEFHVAAVVRGCPCCLASAAWRPWASIVVRSHSLFEEVIGSRIVSETLPNSGTFERAAHVLPASFSSTSQTPFLPTASMAMLVRRHAGLRG